MKEDREIILEMKRVLEQEEQEKTSKIAFYIQ
jgi:hypothetical protein